MPIAYLEKLIQSVTLTGNRNKRPYKNCEIHLTRIDSCALSIGQTFVEREKYRNFIEHFDMVLAKRYCVSRGIAKCNPLRIFAETENGEHVVAHYLPPIVEINNGHQFLVDGIHRNYLAMRVGTTIESVVIKNVQTELPCTPQKWSTITLVDEKPPLEKRFHNLRPELFRDLKYGGIDG
jgi:hypothetical protein